MKKDTQTKNGTTGAQTNAQAKKYEGFTAQAIEQKTIVGNGSTIVNVYYKRNVYEVKFYNDGGREEYTELKISAKYGANISDKWPPYNGSSTWSVNKNVGKGPYQVNIDTMPLGGAKFYGPKTGYGSETAYYYVEVLPGESGTTTYNGVQYKLHHSDTSPGTGYSITDEDKYPITGFKFKEFKADYEWVGGFLGEYKPKYDNAKFYYTRNSYDITFINGGKTEKTESRKYQQDISDVNYTPTWPDGVPANFMFAGWYDNELCEGDPFVFTGTMPAKGITLYAKWQAPQVNATVYLSASADSKSETFSVPYGKKITESEGFNAIIARIKAETGEAPSAWFVVTGEGRVLFDLDTPLYSSVTLYPFFASSSEGYTVTYKEEGTDEPAKDEQKYLTGSRAGILAPVNGENFRAWKTEDGTLIHPGDKITVTKNITLTAVYTKKPQTVTITYHYNFTDKDGNYKDATFKDGNHPKNTNAIVKSLGDVGFKAPTGYEFLGWATTPDSNKIAYAAGATVFVDANGDNHLYAVWQVKTYTVTWVNWNDEVLQTEPDVAYNTMPKAYTGKAPTKPSDEDHDYKFTDWDKPLQKVTSNQVYKAQYEASFNVTYDLNGGAWTTETEDTFRKFKNDQVNVIEAVPTKTGYTFADWTSAEVTIENDAFTMPAKDVTLKAQWNINKYTVTWKNWDGTVLETDTDVEYNSDPSYDGEKPTRAADAQYTYTFKSWTPEVKAVTGNAVYTAVYDKEVNKYTIKWVNWDGSEVRTDTEVPYGTELEVPEDPTRAADAQYTYTFKSWTPEVKTVTGNAVYTAVYEKTVNKYTVTWKNDDGSVLRTDKDVEYGKMPSYGANPTKAADAQYTYTFKSWTPEVKAVTGNAVYTAVYEKTVNKYTVTWKNDDGSVLRTDKDVEYGKMPSYGANPTKAADAQYTYTFKSWTPEVKAVTGNAVYTAVYEKTVNKYTVTWKNDDGSVLRTDKDVEYGKMPSYGANPTKAADAQYTYTFKSWTPEVKTVTGDATYRATYTKEANTYTLTYDLDGGEWENDTTYTYTKKYNEEVEVKADPTKEGYTFVGWMSAEVEVVNGKFTMPAKNVTLKAKWEANIYKVTYDLDGGEWTEATNEFPYEYKATVEVVKTVPTREGYKFSGWRSEEVTIENDAFTMPAKDVVLKAVWEAKPTPTPIPSEEPTPTPAPTEEPTPTPAPTEEPTPTPAPTEESTPTPAPTEESTPTPAPNPNPATPTPTPVAPVVPATVATPTPKPTATPSTTPSDNGGKGDGNNDGEIGETINDNETPLANGEDIADNATPLAGLGTGAWALINLILTIVTTLLSILLLIGYIGKKKKALEDEDGNVVLDENGKEVMEYEKNKKGLWRLISIIPALIAIIVFIFTEDMTLPMIFVDKWTILHVVIALVQVVVMVLCKKKKDENDEDENAANA